MESPSGHCPLVSIIIPLLDKGPHVRRAIHSVLSQTVRDFEIIVIDGGSVDRGPEDVRSISDPRLTLVRQTGRGVSGARNEAVSLARSDFIAFLDADDEWMPDFLETILRLKRLYPDAGAYFTAVRKISPDDSTTIPEYSFVPFKGWEGIIGNYFTALASGDPLYLPSSMAIPRETFTEYGGFPEKASWGEDQDLSGRIALKEPIVFSSNFCSIIHITGDYNEVMCKRIMTCEEHPFLKPGFYALQKGEVSDHETEGLKKWLKLMTVFSIRYNLIAGNSAGARSVLSRYGNRIDRKKRIWLGFWSRMPDWLFHSGGCSLFNLYRASVRWLVPKIR